MRGISPPSTRGLGVDGLHDLCVAGRSDESASQGMFVVANSSDEFSRFVKSEYDKWGKVIKDAKMKVQ